MAGKKEKHVLAGQPVEVRRGYLMALLSLVSADDEVSEAEGKVVEQVSRRLGCALKPEHYQVHDLDRIAEAIQDPAVRRALLGDLLKVAALDGHDPAELGIVKLLAERWNLAPPTAEGVDWAAVVPPDAESLQAWSVARREALSQERAERSEVEGTEPRRGGRVHHRWVWAAWVGVLPLLAALKSFADGQASAAFLLLAGAGAISGLPLWMRALRARWFVTLINAAPTRRVSQAPLGVVAVEGAVQLGADCVHAPLSGIPCAYYQALRTRTSYRRAEAPRSELLELLSAPSSTEEDSLHDAAERARGPSVSTRALAFQERVGPFRLRDRTGSLEVDPGDLAPEWVPTFDRFSGCRELRLEPGATVYLVGTVEVADSGSDRRVLRDLQIFTSSSEAELLERHLPWARRLWLGGALLLGMALAFVTWFLTGVETPPLAVWTLVSSAVLVGIVLLVGHATATRDLRDTLDG